MPRQHDRLTLVQPEEYVDIRISGQTLAAMRQLLPDLRGAAEIEDVASIAIQVLHNIWQHDAEVPIDGSDRSVMDLWKD
jgi:hypothetical protein